jgi:hypothetical protein
MRFLPRKSWRRKEHSMKLRKVLFCIAILCQSLSAMAQGSGVRGDDLLEIKNGLTLREIFIMKGIQGGQIKLGDKMIENIYAISRLVESYTGDRYPVYWQNIMGDLADFRAVKKLPCPADAIATDEFGKPGHDQNLAGACTLNGITYILLEKFQRLSWLDQILLILHERAHAFDESVRSHEWIDPWVQGLAVLIELQFEQQQGKNRDLKAYELRALRILLSLQSKLPHLDNFRFVVPAKSSRHVHVLVHGGGLMIAQSEQDFARARVDEKSFISVDSKWILSDSSCRVGDSVIFINSRLEQGSNVNCANLSSVSLIRSSLMFRPKSTDQIKISGSRFSHSVTQFQGQSIKINGVTLTNTIAVSDASYYPFELAQITVSDREIDWTDSAQKDWASGPLYIRIGVEKGGDRLWGGLPLSPKRKAQSMKEAERKLFYFF